MGEFLAANWFNILSAVGILGSLLFTFSAIRADTKTRRVGNLLTINDNHREIWTEFLNNPELSRVLDSSCDAPSVGITKKERIFVTLVILHLNSVHYALTDHLVINMEGLRQDVAVFFALPIPKTVWEQSRILQNRDFVAFVEECRDLGSSQLSKNI